MEQLSACEWEVDQHRVRWEPPDLMKLTWRGKVLDEHVDGVYAYLNAVRAPRFWLLSDISNSDVPAAPVRAKLARTQAALQVAGIAVIVSSPYKRAVMDMLVRAVNLLSRAQIKPAFFHDEKDARAWIASERQRLGKK